MIVDAIDDRHGLIFLRLGYIGRLAHPNVAPGPIKAKGGRFRHLPGISGYEEPIEIDDPEYYNG